MALVLVDTSVKEAVEISVTKLSDKINCPLSRLVKT